VATKVAECHPSIPQANVRSPTHDDVVKNVDVEEPAGGDRREERRQRASLTIVGQ
jgi:hypothetical protein